MKIGTLIVDDQDDMRFLMRTIIELANKGLFISGEAIGGREAVNAIGDNGHDVVVLDHMMPGMTGLEAAAEIRQLRPEQSMVLCTAYLDDAVRARAGELGIEECLPKESVRDLPEAVRRAARRA
jgi:two-component system response regulator DesR